MNTDEVLHDQVVTVSDGVIVAVDSARRGPMPPGALVLEGGFLIPGLCDMHTHLHRRDPDPEHLVLYFAEGVTTVRAMSGPSENHEWRTMIEAGRLIGPTILTSGRVLIDGLPPEVLTREPVYVPTSAEDAAAEVWRQAESWPDLIKVYDGLTADAYLAAIAAANSAGVWVAGHALNGLTAVDLLGSGINEIAHVDELNMIHWVGKPGDPGFRMDYAAIESTVKLMRAHDVAVVSNLVADEVMYELIYDQESVLGQPRYRTTRPETIERWRVHGRHRTVYADQGRYRRDVEMPFLMALIAALQRAGVLITVGTDASPDLEGSTQANIHRELELLVEAGLTPLEALQIGTRNAGLLVERMGRDGNFGRITPGARADLVLLDDNPLEDVSATRRRRGTMVRGRWYEQALLERMVDRYVTSYEVA
ncbi:MAG TPA: amidohydrolase family protein [Acidimicrobiia bacterium]|nr:amidohydrolase family protein [Acidimicrobiia bacterium]